MLNQFRATNSDTGEVIEGIIKDVAKHICVSESTARGAARNGHKVLNVWSIVQLPPVEGFDKVCEWCGTEFKGCRHDVRFCCTACQKEATKERAKVLRKMRLEENRKRLERQQTITQIAVKARQAGMTYGQYVARMGL